MVNFVVDMVIANASLKRKGVVVLPLKIYEKMKEKLSFLEEETRALQIVAEGEREYKAGKLRPVHSLRELV